MHIWLYQIGNALAVFKTIWVTLRLFLEPFKENLNYQNYFENYSKELQKKRFKVYITNNLIMMQ